MKDATITLNKKNTTGTWTADFDRYEYARTLAPKARDIFFRLGAEIGNDIARRVGYQPDANRACAYARWAGEMANWKNFKTAHAFIVTARHEGYFLV